MCGGFQIKATHCSLLCTWPQRNFSASVVFVMHLLSLYFFLSLLSLSVFLFVSTFSSRSSPSCSSFFASGLSSLPLDITSKLEMHPCWPTNLHPRSMPHPSASVLSLSHSFFNALSLLSELIPPSSNPQQRKRHYWRLDCKCVILFQNNTSNKYYKVSRVYSTPIIYIKKCLFYDSIFCPSSCRRSLCLRSWRFVRLATSPLCPRGPIRTASSSSQALCAIS